MDLARILRTSNQEEEEETLILFRSIHGIYPSYVAGTNLCRGDINRMPRIKPRLTEAVTIQDHQ